MRIHSAVVGVILIAGTAVFSGCAKDPASIGPQQDQDEIRQLVEENIDYFGVDGINDDGAQPMEYSVGLFSKAADLISPVRFGRRGRRRLESVELDFSKEDSVIATIVHSFNGKFFILAKDTLEDGTVVDTLIKKDMENTMLTQAVVVKRGKRYAGLGGQHARKHRKWRMHRISGSVVESPQTSLSIEWVQLVASDGSKWTVDDPFKFMLDVDQLPELERRDTVKVFVKVNNTSPYAEKPGETVMLRCSANRGMMRARKAMRDDGQYPDEIAGDGIYSGMFVVRGRRGMQHAFVDVIDNGTIYDDQLPYNSVAWGFTYLVP